MLGILFGKLLADSEAVAVALECASQVALSALHVADSLVAKGEIALPARIAWVLLGKLLTDSKAVAVALERASQVALSALHVADSLVANGEIALPARIAWILLGKFLGNSKAVAVALERASQVALSALHVADFCIANGEIALPEGIAWILLGQLLTDSKAVAAALERASQVALSALHVALLYECHAFFSQRIQIAGFRWMIFVVFDDARIDGIHHAEATEFAERLAQVVLHVIDQLLGRLFRCDSALLCHLRLLSGRHPPGTMPSLPLPKRLGQASQALQMPALSAGRDGEPRAAGQAPRPYAALMAVLACAYDERAEHVVSDLQPLDSAALLGSKQAACDKSVDYFLGRRDAAADKLGAGVFTGHRVAVAADGNHAVLDVFAHRFTNRTLELLKTPHVKALEDVGSLQFDQSGADVAPVLVPGQAGRH